MTHRGVSSGAAAAGGVIVGGSLTHGRADATTGGTTGGSAGAAVRRHPPRTRLARAVQDLLRYSSPTFLVEHCQRSFQLALLMAAARGLDVDVEVLFAGVMLHDLGLTPAYHSATVRFEVASANAARALVLAHGMSRRRADNVWDVAALHGTGGIADFKSAETATGADGIGADVTGLGLERFDQDEINRIMATRPGFARPFIDAVVADLRDKPQVASSTWMTTVAADRIPGFHQSSIERLALDCPYEHPPMRGGTRTWRAGRRLARTTSVAGGSRSRRCSRSCTGYCDTAAACGGCRGGPPAVAAVAMRAVGDW